MALFRGEFLAEEEVLPVRESCTKTIRDRIHEGFLLPVFANLFRSKEVYLHCIQCITDTVLDVMEHRICIPCVLFAGRILICRTEEFTTDTQTKIFQSVKRFRKRTARPVTIFTGLLAEHVIENIICFAFDPLIHLSTGKVTVEQPSTEVIKLGTNPVVDLIEGILDVVNRNRQNTFPRLFVTIDDSVECLINVLCGIHEEINWHLQELANTLLNLVDVLTERATVKRFIDPFPNATHATFFSFIISR